MPRQFRYDSFLRYFSTNYIDILVKILESIKKKRNCHIHILTCTKHDLNINGEKLKIKTLKFFKTANPSQIIYLG